MPSQSSSATREWHLLRPLACSVCSAIQPSRAARAPDRAADPDDRQLAGGQTRRIRDVAAQVTLGDGQVTLDPAGFGGRCLGRPVVRQVGRLCRYLVTVALRLGGKQGQYLELEIIGYEFPAGTQQGLGKVDNDWDANWLNVRIRVSDGREAWTRADPALLTWELRELARWLAIVANGRRPEPDAWTGLEPNLQLSITTKTSVIAYLDQKFRRPGSMPEEEPTAIELSPTAAEFSEFVNGLEQALVRFPIRFVEDKGPARFHSAERWPSDPEKGGTSVGN